MKDITILFIMISAIISTNNIAINAEQIALNNWQIHTTMHNSLCAVADNNNKIWIGTSGGIVVYANDNDTNPILLNAGNKLLTPTIITMISVGEYVIAGSKEGIIEKININTFDCQHITSIKDHNFNNPQINDFAMLNEDSLLIAGNFGMAILDIKRNIFVRTIYTLGNYPPNTSVNNIVINNDTIYVSTSTGIAFIHKNNQINNPANWNNILYNATYQQAKIIMYNGNIFANLNSSIRRLVNNKFEVFIVPPNVEHNLLFNDIAVYDNKIFVMDEVYIIPVTNIDEPEPTMNNAIYGSGISWAIRNNGFVVIDNDNIETKIIVLHKTLGAVFIKESAFQQPDSVIIKTPNTPFNNNFASITLDKNGILYAVSDNSQKKMLGGNFIMVFDGSNWIKYNPETIDTNATGNFNYITTSPDNKIYATSWGDGMTIINNNSNNINEINTEIIYNNKNSAIWGVADGNYVPCGDVRFDKNNNAWVAIHGATSSGPMLVMFDKSGNSYPFSYSSGNRSVFNMCIDGNNTKWVAGHNDFSVGLYYFNEGNDINNTANHKWGNITTSRYQNLINNYYYACIYDKYTNTIWLGTNNGLSIINNPNAILNSTNPNFIIIKNKLLENQFINDIYIDPIGNKWIATQRGLWVVSMDGTELLAHFNSNNTPLFTNDILTITINNDNGLAYIGTPNGLFIAQSNIVLPITDYDIKIYPQPFNIRKHSNVIIDGLTSQSDVRIVTADGTLIKRLITSSRQVVWDGTDENNNLVVPGIYIILCNSEISNSGSAGKIVVVDY